MARLNEPMVSTDSVETLRRKFLRQNRDIARINSTQSLKIRTLENECVRLLSENLDLRGQILRLQTELEDSRAQRIANHALEIKEKMEAQLAEWGTMLASLGHEPTPRTRSPRSPKRLKRRSSIGRVSMSEWRRRDTVSSMRDLEAAALQEGRLAPIWENKTCPRETLNRDEILALRAVVDDNDDSPDLGPPPVSRLLDEDPVKIDLPPRHAPSKSDYASLEKASSDPRPKEPASSPKEEEMISEPVSDPPEVNNEPAGSKAIVTTEPQPPAQLGKANLKRKLREEDEKENMIVSKPSTRITGVARDQPEKMGNIKTQHGSRPIKLPSNRRDARDRSTGSVTQRKPLGAKSTNEHIKSPKKTTKPEASEEITKEDLKEKKSTLVEIPVPEPQPVLVANVEAETETLSADPNLAVPDTPEATPREEVRDTPPPADISSGGEVSRGSRRARAAVSYAEPNLRDKMRRPTKQLFDAVSGEGKHIRRTSQSKKEDFPSSNPSSVAKSEEKSGAWREFSSDRNMSRTSLDVMASPLARKGSKASSDDLSTSVAMDRKKRTDAESPSCSSGESSTTRSHSRIGSRRVDEIAAREAEVAKIFDDKADIYEFPSSSPKDGSKRAAATTEEGAKKRSTKGSRQSRSRRLSSIAREDQDPDVESQNHEKGLRHAGSRRATMAASKESKMDVENAGHDNSMEGDSLNSSSSGDMDASTRDRASMRRRSMML
ncbi:hypothetical protein F5Y11DRAFT_314116 [Daldinia sp. FL1419]|nr:hypothetical protein F5Y11DRAFT_314116 [Daldinia sp. FL1419]